MQIQISWLLKKPADLDLHSLQRQDISGFSRTRFKRTNTTPQAMMIHGHTWLTVGTNNNIDILHLILILGHLTVYHTFIGRPRWSSWMRVRLETRRSRVSTPAEVINILLWRLIMKYFLRPFSPFRWFKKGSYQFLAKECAQYWLTA